MVLVLSMSKLLELAGQFRDKALGIFGERAKRKYDHGQREHGGYLPSRCRLDDLEEELIDAWFYLQAMKQRQGELKGAKIKRIHVNQHKVRSNLKNGLNEAVITVKEGNTNKYVHGLEIHGPCRVIYRPEKPLACGARIWIETKADIDEFNPE